MGCVEAYVKARSHGAICLFATEPCEWAFNDTILEQ